MSEIHYNADAQRYSVDGVDLHAGFPVTVIKNDGSKFETRIEHDEGGWYLIDWPKPYDIEGLKVESY